VITIHDLVEAKLYKTEEEVVQDALRHLIQARPNLKIELAIHRYKTEDISVGKAARLAGVSFEQMKEILLSHGVQPRLGPESEAEARAEVATLEKFGHESNR